MVEGQENLSEVNQQLKTFNEAIKLILSLKKNITVGTEEINLNNSLNRILSKKLKTLCDNPPTDVSSMDGYAINEKDHLKKKILEVIDESSAGRPSNKNLTSGKAVRIFTGAAIPKGANKVIIQENIKVLEGKKRVEQTKYRWPSG